MEGEIDVYTKKCNELATQIEGTRTREKDIQESIEEESKHMEKMANKRAVKLRKVGKIDASCVENPDERNFSAPLPHPAL